MRTVRPLVARISQHALLRGCTWSRGGGTWSRGVYLPGGGGYLPRYCPLPLWTEFLTHASENITLPQTSFAGGNYHRTQMGTCVGVSLWSMNTSSQCYSTYFFIGLGVGSVNTPLRWTLFHNVNSEGSSSLQGLLLIVKIFFFS